MANDSNAVSGRLREAIVTASQTRYQIAKETGIAASVLSRFVNGKSGLDLLTVDRLCEHLGLELLPRKRKKRQNHENTENADL